ncbi:coil containing protein [Vibrio phage 1.232.O._10N.261.51.E11]|nr:coil containing protein [Vibrio phage 1.232.O._10N.261.51.E11]
MTTNSYYTPSQRAVPATTVRSAQFNDNNAELVDAFDLLPAPITLFSGNQNFGVDTGLIENIYEVTIRDDVITSYTDGLTVQVRAAKANTGSAQVQVNELGLRQIRNQNGDQVVVGDILVNRVMVLRYNAMTTFFTLDIAESTINDAVEEAQAAAAEALASQNAAANSATQAANSATSSAESATASANSATEAAASAEIINGVLILPTIDWVQGTNATNGFQRYIFNGNIFIAPAATATNPIPLGATPIGDSNWISWSDPVRFFPYEETTTTDKSVFNVGSIFSEIGDVFVDTNLQSTDSYTINGGLQTVTFNEDVPSGTYVKIWVGRSADAIVSELQTLTADSVSQIETARDSAVTTVNNTRDAAVVTVNDTRDSAINDINTAGNNFVAQQTQLRDETIAAAATVQEFEFYDAGDITTPTTIFRPGRAFTNADLYAGGVPQRPGANNAYVIEADSTNPAFNQIRFNQAIPSGVALFGTTRRSVV